MRNIKLYEEVNDKSDMMGFVFYISITGRDIAIIGYHIIIANNFFDAAKLVAGEFAEDVETDMIIGYDDLMNEIGKSMDDSDGDNFDHIGWCGLKPKRNDEYSFWMNEPNPLKIMDQIKDKFINADEIFSQSPETSLKNFDKCVIDSLVKSPSEIKRFADSENLDKIIKMLPNGEKYKKILRAHLAIKNS